MDRPTIAAAAADPATVEANGSTVTELGRCAHGAPPKRDLR